MSKKENVSVCPAKKTSIGGQALIEGIMMRGPKMTAMAVRNPEGEIVLEKWENEASKRPAVFRWPFIRGIFNFIDSMRIGYKCLMRSAEIASAEILEDQKAQQKEGNTGSPVSASAESVQKQDVTVDAVTSEEGKATAETVDEPLQEKATEKKQDKAEGGFFYQLLMVISSVLGVALALLLFMYLPAQLYNWLSLAFPAISDKYALRAVFEGVLKIAIFVGYMAMITLMKDIRRTFMYHGAEHKTIFCYENGLPLTVENVRQQRRFHPRCGTSFMILMLLVSIILSMFIRIDNPFIRTGVKVLLIPVLVGIGYELIKLAGRKNNWLTRIISAPGMWLQHISTKEPDDSMIECAIKAFNEVLPEDGSDKW